MLQTEEQEERAVLIEVEKQRARDMCGDLFRGSNTIVRWEIAGEKEHLYVSDISRASDIPFQGWSSSQIVSLMLEDVIDKVSITHYFHF